MKPDTIVTKETLVDRMVRHWMGDQNECCLWGIISLDKPLSDDIIEKSIAISIKCVPIISSRLSSGLWLGRWLFVDPGDPGRLCTRKTAPDKSSAEKLLKEIIRNPIDAKEPPVFRVTSIDAPEDYYLVLQVHHMMMDGEGSKHFFELFAKIYRELEKDSKWQPACSLDMNRSWSQLIKFLKWHDLLRIPFAVFQDIRINLYALMKKKEITSTIAGDTNGKTESILPEDPLFETITISGDEIEKIKGNKIGISSKINDFIVAALMTTVNHWNVSRGQKFEYVNTVYTVNLRRWWGWPKGIFANMSVVRMTLARAEEVADVHKALKVLKPKFDKAKKSFGLVELFGFLIFSIQPELTGKLIGFSVTKLVKETHGLTNIGIISDHAGNFGSASARTYSLLAPPLASPNVMFTASGFKNGLTIHMNFNPRHMKLETAKAFLRQLKKNLLSLSDL